MSTAIIADIHANLEALQAVLDRIAALKVDEILCLGDVVGYNANPNECVDLIRNERIACVLGNHDASASGLEEPDRFNPFARTVILWTREHLTDENRQFLLDLPREKQVHDLYLFHGSIHDTNRYLVSRLDAFGNFQLLDELGAAKVGFFGHTHVRTAWSDDQGALAHEDPTELPLSTAKRYLVNPGSVGQPRDGDPRASFLVYDRDDRIVTFFRVEYDIKTCQEKILRAGLPPRLAERLAWGQ